MANLLQFIQTPLDQIETYVGLKAYLRKNFQESMGDRISAIHHLFFSIQHLKDPLSKEQKESLEKHCRLLQEKLLQIKGPDLQDMTSYERRVNAIFTGIYGTLQVYDVQDQILYLLQQGKKEEALTLLQKKESTLRKEVCIFLAQKEPAFVAEVLLANKAEEEVFTKIASSLVKDLFERSEESDQLLLTFLQSIVKPALLQKVLLHLLPQRGSLIIAHLQKLPLSSEMKNKLLKEAVFIHPLAVFEAREHWVGTQTKQQDHLFVLLGVLGYVQDLSELTTKEVSKEVLILLSRCKALYQMLALLRPREEVEDLTELLIDQLQKEDYFTQYVALLQESRDVSPLELACDIIRLKWKIESNNQDPWQTLHPSKEDLFLLLSIEKISTLSPVEKSTFFQRYIEQGKPFFNVQFSLQKGLVSLGQLYRSISSSLPDLMRQILIDPSSGYRGLQGVDDVAERYIKTLGSMRVPFALETYEKAVKSLKDPALTLYLERFVCSVLLGTFQEERYKVCVSDHLQALQKYDEALLLKWRVPMPFKPLKGTGDLFFQAKSLEGFFQQKLKDGHGMKEGKDLFPQLTAFVLEPDLQKREQIFTSTDEEGQRLCMRLIQETHSSKQLELLGQAIQAISLCDVELSHDLQGLAQHKELLCYWEDGCRIEDTDDWQDLFLSGTEVSGSCLRVDGYIQKTKCLLAYVLDGKNRMIAIKDAKGSVLARSMLRLLWDASSQKPVVFLDRIYPYSLPSLLEKAIQAYAKEKAFALGLELVSCDLKGMLPYQGRVCSLASSSPYEYADGGEGVTLGVFQIFNPCYVVPSFS